jgi:hypothetical protein
LVAGRGPEYETRLETACMRGLSSIYLRHSPTNIIADLPPIARYRLPVPFHMPLSRSGNSIEIPQGGWRTENQPFQKALAYRFVLSVSFAVFLIPSDYFVWTILSSPQFS